MELFEEACEALRGLVPPELGPFRHKTHRYGTKIWFGTEAPPKEHFEAQVVGVRDVPPSNSLNSLEFRSCSTRLPRGSLRCAAATTFVPR